VWVCQLLRVLFGRVRVKNGNNHTRWTIYDFALCEWVKRWEDHFPWAGELVSRVEEGQGPRGLHGVRSREQVGETCTSPLSFSSPMFTFSIFP
jgi:hypothetical protein